MSYDIFVYVSYTWRFRNDYKLFAEAILRMMHAECQRYKQMGWISRNEQTHCHCKQSNGMVVSVSIKTTVWNETRWKYQRMNEHNEEKKKKFREVNETCCNYGQFVYKCIQRNTHSRSLCAKDIGAFHWILPYNANRIIATLFFLHYSRQAVFVEALEFNGPAEKLLCTAQQKHRAPELTLSTILCRSLCNTTPTALFFLLKLV